MKRFVYPHVILMFFQRMKEMDNDFENESFGPRVAMRHSGVWLHRESGCEFDRAGCGYSTAGAGAVGG